MRKITWVIVLILWNSCPSAAVELLPFALPYNDGTDTFVSMAALNEIPAGKDGFIQVQGEHFVTGSGQRIRFLGVNGSFSGNFPDLSEAEGIAGRLAKFGVNCFRHHHMDTQRAPNGLISRDYDDTQHLDETNLDRLDYFIFQLKQHGIYSDLNLHVGRQLNEADGFDAPDKRPKYDKGLDQYHPGMIQMQKNYAHDLLTHENPYTGNTYLNEPSIAMIEITNEDSLIRIWGSGDLDNIPDSYLLPLQQKWNQFLLDRYEETSALEKAWNPAQATDGPQLISQDFSQWWTQIISPASATTEILADSGPGGESILRVAVLTTDPISWHIQSMNSGFEVTGGDLMLAEVWVRADPARTASLSVSQHHDPWGGLGLRRDMNLTPDWQKFSFAFTCLESDSNARYTVGGLASTIGQVEIASPTLRRISPTGLPPGQFLEEENIAVLDSNSYNLRSATCRADWTEFLVETEESYFAEMYDYLKNTLGVKCPITGTQMGYGVIGGQYQLDFVDAHAYWKHPQFPGQPWDPVNWVVTNESIQNSLPKSPITSLASRRPYGKPYTVTEYNHPAPNIFGAETFLMLAAYGALQDWDGIFAYSYSHNKYSGQSIDSFFDIVGHTPKMLTLPAAAALFRRGDVTPAQSRLSVTVARKDLLAKMVLQPGQSSLHSTGYWGLDEHWALTDQIGVYYLASPDAKSVTRVSHPAETNMSSDNGEILWNGFLEGKAYTKIKTSRSEVFTGFIGGESIGFDSGIEFRSPTAAEDWITLTLTVMEGESFLSSGKWLLTLSGYAENQGMVWKDETRSSCGNQWGSGPPLVEAPTATLRIPLPVDQVKVYSLDETGEILSPLSVSPGWLSGNCQVELNRSLETLWYRIDVDRHEEKGSLETY